jgi:hypothetical protein
MNYTTPIILIVDLSDGINIRVVRAFKSSANGIYLPIAQNSPMSGETAHPSNLHRIGKVVKQLVISPDGQWLASADVERRVQVFNMDAMKVS